jgi:NAD(P)-dependent dehydrogenase (short-subunit alcohol dehydrogenase family)
VAARFPKPEKEISVFDLSGKVVVVTGGNGGIGLGLAKGVAKAGADVCIWGRNESKNEAAVAELRELGGRVEACRCDVADEAQVVSSVGETLKRLGRIDGCFGNAGYGRGDRFVDMTLEHWNEILTVNLNGVMLTFREVAKHMIERGGGGKLVAIGSIGEISGMPAQAHYSASKAGLGALVRSLAVELGRYDIQVNTIQPGWIMTAPMEAAVAMPKGKALEEAVLHRTPAKRWGTPEDLEGIAVYLASDASGFHTGDTLRLDGGYAVF